MDIVEHFMYIYVHWEAGGGCEDSRAPGQIFGLVKKEQWVLWEVYKPSGRYFLLSFWCSRLRILLCSIDGIPLFGGEISHKLDIQVFEKGLDIVGDEIDYALRHFGFLILINDKKSKLSFLLVILCS